MSLNLYTYCANNPLIYYDPTGHNWITSGFSKVGNGIKNFANSYVDAAKIYFDPVKRDNYIDKLNTTYGNTGNKFVGFFSDALAAQDSVLDLFADPVNQMNENNKVMKSVVTNNLGIKEGTFLYNSIKNVGTMTEAVGINGINLGKGAWQMGETMGKPIANTALLGINYAQMKTGSISGDDFYGWYDSWYSGAEADNQDFINLVPNMVKGIGNSAVGLYNNGFNFFNPHATLEQKTQAVGDFYNVAFTVEAAKGIIDSGVPVLKTVARNARNNFTNNTSPQFSMAGGTGIPFTEGLNAMNTMGKIPLRNIVNATTRNGVNAGAGGRLREALKKAQEDAAKRKQMSAYEEHHWINQATLNGKNPHPFIKKAHKLGVDIIKEKWNIESIPHRGGHTDVYYDFVRTKLDNVYEIYNQSGSSWSAAQMREALIDVKNQIKTQYESGNLNLYK